MAPRASAAQTWVLIACGRAAVAAAISAAVQRTGAAVEVFSDGAAVLGALKRRSYAVACIDLALPGEPGLALAERLAEGAPGCRLLLLAQPVTAAAARAALRVRAVDCVGDDEAAARAGQLAAELVRRPPVYIPSALLAPGAESWHAAGLSGRSPPMRKLLSDLLAVAPSDTPVLISGESGTGKERCAQALHRLSARRERPLVTLRCQGLSAAGLVRALYQDASGAAAELSPSSDEDEARGAEARGALHRARGGTLLLDGVTALEGDAQDELLRALAASLPPIASRTAWAARPPRRLPAPRLVAIASEELQPLVRRGRFRRELYHRIAVVRLPLPPLRARRDDIPLLAAELLAERGLELGRRGLGLSPDAVGVLCRYPWPGNVRELRNVIWHAALRAHDGQIRAADVQDLLDVAGSGGRIEIALGSSLAAAEREIILQTLAALGGNKKQAAESLVIARRTLYLKLQQYGEGGPTLSATAGAATSATASAAGIRATDEVVPLD
ncbi:MAG: sigma 54-interacting transcriptional regulator [Polyangia bacterium]